MNDDMMNLMHQYCGRRSTFNWRAVIEMADLVMAYMRPSMSGRQVRSDRKTRFDAFVAARLYRDAARELYKESNVDLNCNSATEALLDVTAEKIRLFALDDRAERDLVGID